MVPCRGCGRGEYRDREDPNECTYCPTGFYQDQDNHEGNLFRTTECKMCPPGSYAPKLVDHGHFDKMPLEILPICSEANDLGKAQNCDLIHGWHINKDGQIDSSLGIPLG